MLEDEGCCRRRKKKVVRDEVCRKRTDQERKEGRRDVIYIKKRKGLYHHDK